ncbi:hypothetical protein Franean1_4591 [Parafrankia sp. EAN1pec]|uniref:hypothetical protein n=1 Tax=Parafrankia sp. (strain EAN1pec) TaxID=298653 RepID=UPI0000544B26|nr:hypothetical protein Franean1_4591 [Frankia sp. EAN1pec]
MEKEPTRPLDDDDHDLLNFDETGGRLRAEIAAVEAALAALARNSWNAAARPGETGFLTYVPPGRADPPFDGTAAPSEE